MKSKINAFLLATFLLATIQKSHSVNLPAFAVFLLAGMVDDPAIQKPDDKEGNKRMIVMTDMTDYQKTMNEIIIKQQELSASSERHHREIQ